MSVGSIRREIWTRNGLLMPRCWLLARDHRGGLAFEVDVGLAADVDRHHVDGAAGEVPGALARVVGGDAGPAPADGQVRAGEAKLPGLSFDASLADLLLAVIQG